MPDPRIQRAYNKVSSEMPDIQGVNVGPSDSAYQQIMNKNRYGAVTSPMTGNITYNPTFTNTMSDPELENLIAHEMTHAQQFQNMPWYQRMYQQLFGVNHGNNTPAEVKGTRLDYPYFWDPNEQQAFQAERNRILAQHQWMPTEPTTGESDIHLPRIR